MIRLCGGKAFLWQWDVGQYLEIDTGAAQAHFKLDAQTAVSVEVKEGRAKIPDTLLQKAGSLLCYTYDGEATVSAFQFGVKPRPQPPGYAFTETDRKSWAELEGRVSALEEGWATAKASSFDINEEGHLILTINDKEER